MNKKLFHHLVFVFSIKEAEDRAREAGLTREEFKICGCKSDLFGVHLPTKKQLYLLPAAQDEAIRRGLMR